MSNQLTKLRTLARVMDDAVAIPGTRFRVGLDALLGLVPGVGDVAGGVTTAYTILAAHRLGAPKSVLIRMLWNVLVDTIFGSVPVLGDLFDAAFRANRRNVELVEQFAAAPAQAERSSLGFVVVLLVSLVAIVIGGLAVAFLVARAAYTTFF